MNRYFLRKLRRVKKANGQILSCNEVRKAEPVASDASTSGGAGAAGDGHLHVWEACRTMGFMSGFSISNRAGNDRQPSCLCCLQIFERKPTTVKNYGIWVRYQSRTGYHNMYKEYRDVTLNGAVGQLYQEMASRHRVRQPCIQIIKTATVPASACKRPNTQQVCRMDGCCGGLRNSFASQPCMHINLVR
jgi:ribosomal protein L20A (L18A)